MLDIYYKDFSDTDKVGKWGIEPNRLIRYDLEGKMLYFYDFKDDVFSSYNIIFVFINEIINPLRFLLVDNGQIMPLTLIDRYKFYSKVMDKYYLIKNQLEQERNMEAIRLYAKNKPTSRTIDRHSRIIGGESFAFGRGNEVINKHSGRTTNMDALNEKINRLIRVNEERVKRGY